MALRNIQQPPLFSRGVVDPKVPLLVRFLISSWFRQMLFSPDLAGILKGTEVTLAQPIPLTVSSAARPVYVYRWQAGSQPGRHSSGK